MKLSKLILAAGLFITCTSQALVELKAGYGILASSGSLNSFYSGSDSDIPSAVPTAGLTLDGVIKIPFVGIGAGIRNESMKIDYDSSILGVSSTMNRTALILNYRLLDTIVYLGPIMTYGLNHSNSIKLKSGGSTQYSISSSKVSSYSLGLEVGATLLGILVGAEAGTHSMKYNDAKDSLHPSQIHDMDMSGPYAKLFIGFGI